MDIYNQVNGIGDKYQKVVVALGNFDGLHQGHRKLISELVQYAKEIGGTPGILTFYPHPLEVLRPEQKPPLLMGRDDKIALLKEMGVKIIIYLPFNKEFSELSPDEFVEKIVVNQLKAKGVFVGYNYNFGHHGQGNPELLQLLGDKLKFHVRVIPQVCIEGQPVSSTRVRNLLLEGKVEEAAKLLGYLPNLLGEVVHGEKRGRTIGFPTANIEAGENILIPANGVYAVKIYIDKDEYQGICNIGHKPTFHQEFKKTIEVNIFDFDQDIYNKQVRVEFIDFIRHEMKFNGIDYLISQINKDIEGAHVILKNENPA
jgi:riboflavin kinase / FMN adenylyltransferase